MASSGSLGTMIGVIFPLLVSLGGCGENEREVIYDPDPRWLGVEEQGEGGAGGVPTKSSSCPQYLEDGERREVLVRIVNASADVLYLGQTEKTCVAEPLIRVWDEYGNVLPEPNGCASCQDLALGQPDGCPVDCVPPVVVTLQPGESTETTWSGLFTSSTQVDPDCFGLPEPVESSFTCLRAVHPRRGDYEFAANASRQLLCVDESDDCERCVPRESGGCEVTDAVLPRIDRVAVFEAVLTSEDDFGLGEPISLVFTD